MEAEPRLETDMRAELGTAADALPLKAEFVTK